MPKAPGDDAHYSVGFVGLPASVVRHGLRHGAQLRQKLLSAPRHESSRPLESGIGSRLESKPGYGWTGVGQPDHLG
eukprot:4670447-Pyramimonas_sp.AAC.1